ncbi:hypothetical protein PLCT1_00617 [Planctomycetaceae bacterium]|nr:hypothetical protein PLCT1_00617 [Planctomycetaceae bacterium]
MAGPRPMPNQPPGYQQQYAPPGGYQQPPYPQKKGSSGIMKGCIIAFVVIFILGIVGVVGIGGLAWFGISKASQMFDKEVDSAVSVSDDFMKKLAAGDVKGAHSLCDSTISEPQLGEFYKAYEKVLKDNKGLKYNTIDIMGVQLRGNVSIQNDDAYVSLQPADAVGQTDVKVVLQMHRPPGASAYKVRYIAITGYTPAEGGGTLGDTYTPTHSSRHD